MSELRNRLVEIEPLSAERNEKLQREIQAMFEPKMSRWDKMYWEASAAGSLLFAVVAIPMVFVAPVSPVERKLWAIFGVLNAMVGVFLVWRVWKGSMHFGQQVAGSKGGP